jgi:hypothetical protein
MMSLCIIQALVGKPAQISRKIRQLFGKNGCKLKIGRCTIAAWETARLLKVTRTDSGTFVFRHRTVTADVIMIVGIAITLFCFMPAPQLFPLGLMCLFVGLAMSQRSSFVFDLTNRKVSWHKRWTAIKKSGELSFDDIDECYVDESDDGGAYTIFLSTKSADIRMTDTYYRGADNINHVAHQICAGTGIPFCDPERQKRLRRLYTESSSRKLSQSDYAELLTWLLKRGATVDGIRLVRNHTGKDLKAAKQIVDRRLTESIGALDDKKPQR